MTSEKENHACCQYGYRKKLKYVHQYGIKASEIRSKDAVCSGQAINHKLQHFQVDYQKADIDKEVKKCRDDFLKHLLLPKGNQEHISDAFILAIKGINLLA